MSGKGWDLTCDGGEGYAILTAALSALPPDYVARVEWDDEDGDERVGDYTVRAEVGGLVTLTPSVDDGIEPGPAVKLFVGDIRSVTIY